MFTFKSQKKELNPKSIFFFWILVISLNFEGYKNEPWLNITNAFLSLCIVQFSSLSRVQPFATPWSAVHQASLSLTNSWSLLKFMSIESVMPSNPSHPLSSPSPAFNLSQHQGLFKWVNPSNQEGKVLEFQLQHQSFQWIFRTDLL